MAVSTSNQRLAKNTYFLYIRMIVLMLVTLYTSRVVIDILGVEDFGIYNIIGGIIVLLSFMKSTMTSGLLMDTRKPVSILLASVPRLWLGEVTSCGLAL